jgi:hypothetical protein
MLVLLLERIYEHAAEMGSGAIICIPCFIKIYSRVQKLSRGGGQIHIQTQRQQGDFISLVLFFKIRNVG